MARRLVAETDAYGPLTAAGSCVGVADDGVAEVTCEIDGTNTASRPLFASLGAVAAEPARPSAGLGRGRTRP